MGKLRHRKLKPGETIFGGGKGILIPLKSTPIASEPPQQSIPRKTPEQLRELEELERMASLEAHGAMSGRPCREEEQGQEKPER